MARKISLVMVLMIFLFSAVMVNATPAEPDAKTMKKIVKQMEKADKKLKKKDIAKAMEHYNNVLDLSEEYPPVYFKIGQIYLAQKKYDGAIMNFEKAVKLKPDFKEACLGLIQALVSTAASSMKQKDIEKANEYYLKALAIPGIEKFAPKAVAEVTFWVGINYMSLRNTDKSTEYLKKVVAFPDIQTLNKRIYVDALYQIGSNYYNSQKLSNAGEYFAKVLAIDALKTEYLERYVWSNYYLGLSYTLTNKRKEAIPYLIEYLTVTQNNPNDQNTALANLMVGTNNFEILQEKVLEIEKDKAEKKKHEKIAELAKAAKDVEPYFLKVIELKDPKFMEDAYMNLGNYYYMCMDYDKAIQAYDSLIQAYPNSANLESYKAFLEDLKKDKKKNKK